MAVILSVIMPAFNSEKYINTSIQSVLSQSVENLELIVVDDGSKDSTQKIVRDLASKDERIKLLTLRTNRGVSFARNSGVKVSSGKYVAFLDADDEWYPQKAEIQINYMENTSSEFSYLNYQLINNDGDVVGTRMISKSGLSYSELLKGNRIGLLTVMLSREVAVRHPFPEVPHEDYACWLSILKDISNANRASVALLAKYRIHSNSLSSNKVQAAKWTWQIYKREGLSRIRRVYYFLHYMYMAISKRR